MTDRSVDPSAWGDLLTSVFDEWVVRDVGPPCPCGSGRKAKHCHQRPAPITRVV